MQRVSAASDRGGPPSSFSRSDGGAGFVQSGESTSKGHLKPDEVWGLLSELCARLGFCFPLVEVERLATSPPDNSHEFTEAVLVTEGLWIFHLGSGCRSGKTIGRSSLQAPSSSVSFQKRRFLAGMLRAPPLKFQINGPLDCIPHLIGSGTHEDQVLDLLRRYRFKSVDS